MVKFDAPRGGRGLPRRPKNSNLERLGGGCFYSSSSRKMSNDIAHSPRAANQPLGGGAAESAFVQVPPRGAPAAPVPTAGGAHQNAPAISAAERLGFAPPGHPITRGGRPTGAINFCKLALALMFHCIRKWLPAGPDAWERTALDFNHVAREKTLTERDGPSLKKKFYSLVAKTKADRDRQARRKCGDHFGTE